MSNWPNPFIEQRADPYILRHQDHYYFIASVPEYDRLEIRRAATLEGLREAPPVVVWRKPESGPMSQLIWAPELHEIDGKWYIYFAAAHTHDRTNSGCSSTGCLSSNVPTATRSAASGLKRSGKTPFDTFALDATTFQHQGRRWYLWAQKAPHIAGNTNLYLAELANPWTLKVSL